MKLGIHRMPALLVVLFVALVDGFSSSPFLKSSRKPSHLRVGRHTSKRWNGNYKHVNKKLSEVSKSKKLKFELTAGGVTKVFEKKRMETVEHVLTKAVIWKLFQSDYPGIEVELHVGDPDYLPDIVGLNSANEPIFWGESGRMKVHKAVDLMERYPDAHIVHCRWGMDIEEFSAPLLEHLRERFDSKELDLSWRKGRFTFCSLPLDVCRFIDENNMTVNVTREDLDWKELKFPTSDEIP